MRKAAIDQIFASDRPILNAVKMDEGGWGRTVASARRNGRIKPNIISRGTVLLRMEELIKRLSGKKIDVSCGMGAVLRGEVIDVKDGVLYMRDEDDKAAYISIDKIASVYECSDSASRPGFVG